MKTISFILILLCLISFPREVNSQQFGQRQPTCIPYEKFINLLKTEYTESLKFRGISEKGKVLVEVWVNEDSGTFTIVRIGMIEGKKRICASIGGDAWHEAVEKVKKERAF